MPVRSSSPRAGRARVRARGPWVLAAASLAALAAVSFGGCGLSTSGTAPPPGAPCSEAAHCDDGNPCTTDVCGPDGACVGEVMPDGPLDEQVAGDCLTRTCLGGELFELPSETDFADDANTCTFDTCLDGEPRNTAKPNGQACLEGQAQGLCQNGECAVTCGAGLPACDDSNPCTEDACDAAAGQCVFTDRHGVPPLGHTEAAGDCGITLCVEGAVMVVIDDDDLPVTPNECDQELCMGGMPMNPPQPSGAPCGGDGVCDGQAQCVECNGPTDCTALPPDDECQQRTCVNHACGQDFTNANTPLGVQAPGDCQTVVCDGNGGTTSLANNADLPDDGRECTTDTCTNGVPANTPLSQGTSCGTGNNLFCDSDGDCVGCNTAADCGANALCGTRTCNNQQCGWSYTQAGPLPAQNQIPGDCQVVQCTGSSEIPVTVTSTSDVPPDDNNQCTSEACSGSMPTHPPRSVNFGCSQNGGLYCDGAGACVPCNMASQCPAGANACTVAACSSSHQCGFTYPPSGTPITDPTPGDCKRPECDGAGAITIVNYAMDLPNDGNQCTADTCVSGTPTYTNVNDGTACNQNGGQLCSSGTCKKTLGQTCVAAAECVSGNCVDGRCCNSACNGDCVSCNNAAGTCTNVASGQQDTCPAGNACNSSGVCRKINGQNCATGPECLSTFCVDGVCCNSGCTQACYACNVGSSAGTCSPNPALQGQPDTCAANQACDTNGNCDLANGQGCSNNNQCASGACVDSVCCNNGCTQACYSCNVAGSEGTCSVNPALNGQPDTCSANHVCDGGECLGSNGASCSSPDQCVSGFCADGVCCNAACGQSCHACNVTGNGGTCSPDPSTVGVDDSCPGNQTCDAAGACN